MVRFFGSAVSFGLAFFLSTILIGVPESAPHRANHACDSGHGSEVVQLLRQDVRNGERLERHVVSRFSSEISIEVYSEIVEDYVDASTAIEFDHLPEDFSSAWKAHMKAWRAYSNHLNRMKLEESSLDIRALLKRNRSYNKEIRDTWYETLRVARKYDRGADLEIYR